MKRRRRHQRKESGRRCRQGRRFKAKCCQRVSTVEPPGCVVETVLSDPSEQYDGDELESRQAVTEQKTYSVVGVETKRKYRRQDRGQKLRGRAEELQRNQERRQSTPHRYIMRGEGNPSHFLTFRHAINAPRWVRRVDWAY